MSRARSGDQNTGGSDVVELPDTPAGEDGLTERQRRILHEIRLAVQTRGYPPSVREIGNVAGLTRRSSAKNPLKALNRKGY